MLSRVANSIYWMSRYLERADNVARFIDVNIHLILDSGLEDAGQWKSLVIASGDDKSFEKKYKKFNENNVVHFLTFDKKNPNSIISCVEMARENARTIREAIPSEIWGKINEFYHMVRKHSRKKKADGLRDFYSMVKETHCVLLGMMENTMFHGIEWHFSRLGRLLECADKTARILDVKYFLLLPSLDYVDSPYDSIQWIAVLQSVNAFEMSLKKFQQINAKNVTQFLVFEPFFPRSIFYCINTAAESLKVITGQGKQKTPALNEMKKLQEFLKNTHVEETLSKGLHEFIDTFQYNLNILDHAINQSFFEMKPSPR